MTSDLFKYVYVLSLIALSLIIDDTHKEALSKNRIKLLYTLIISEQLFSCMMDSGLLINDLVERIQSKKT